MVSSIAHTLQGKTDEATLAVAVGFFVFCLLRSRATKIWVILGIFPLLYLPDYVLPLTCEPGPWCQALTFLTTPAVIGAVLFVATMHYMMQGKEIPDHYLVDESVISSFKVLGVKEKPALDDIPQLVEELRTSFNAGLSRPIAKRVQQLNALLRFFTENEAAILEALRQDLGRPTFEGLYYDNILPISEIKEAIRELHHWAACKPKGFHVLTFPSSQWLQPEPLGVALIISTWNYPILLGLSPAVGAIAAGCTVLLKPCVVSKATATLMMELLPKYMDKNVFAVVGGDYDRDSICTNKLLENKFDAIFFTGSPRVGRVIMEGAAKHLTPTILELGGKNPVFVDKAADIDLAAKRVVWGRMMNAGQQCISPDYVLCDKKVLEKFLNACKKYVASLYGENPKDNGNFGRIVGDKQFERLQGLLDHHKKDIVCGGESDAAARYIGPTVVSCSLGSPIMAEETFGPILAVVGITDVFEAINYVNARPKPLSLYIFSADERYQQIVACNTSSGGVTINATLFHVAHGALPFGGVGDSGMGGYHGKASFDCFSHDKPVLVKATWIDPFVLYPPWTGLKLKVLRLLGKIL